MSSSAASAKGASVRATKAKRSAATYVGAGSGESSLTGADLSNGYFSLLALVAMLCLFGLMMVLSASSIYSLRVYGNSWMLFEKQLLWLFLGVAVLWATVRIDYQVWRRWALPLVGISLVLLLLVLVPGIGVSVSGSRRWLGPGMFRMQPSEIAKLALLLFVADVLDRRHHLVHNWKATMQPVGLLFIVMGALVMLQPDMGTTMVLGSIAGVTLFVGGTSWRAMAKLFTATIGIAVVMASSSDYRRKRLLSFIDPFKDAGNTGYQVVQSLVGIGSGGITGVGLGASRAKWGFLPNAHTDFIFAIIAEELGLIGAVLVVLLFVGFAALGVRAACRAPDRFGMLLAAGITAWVVCQAFLNIGAVIGILPVTGVPLPFLSQGGSSLVILMVATGILLNIARQGEMGRSPRHLVSKATPSQGRKLTRAEH